MSCLFTFLLSFCCLEFRLYQGTVSLTAAADNNTVTSELLQYLLAVRNSKYPLFVVAVGNYDHFTFIFSFPFLIVIIELRVTNVLFFSLYIYFFFFLFFFSLVLFLFFFFCVLAYPLFFFLSQRLHCLLWFLRLASLVLLYVPLHFLTALAWVVVLCAARVACAKGSCYVLCTSAFFFFFFSLSLLDLYSDEGRKKGNKNSSGEVDCSEHRFFFSLMCFLGENLLLHSLSWHGGKSCFARRAETG